MGERVNQENSSTFFYANDLVTVLPMLPAIPVGFTLGGFLTTHFSMGQMMGFVLEVAVAVLLCWVFSIIGARIAWAKGYNLLQLTPQGINHCTGFLFWRRRFIPYSQIRELRIHSWTMETYLEARTPKGKLRLRRDRFYAISKGNAGRDQFETFKFILTERTGLKITPRFAISHSA